MRRYRYILPSLLLALALSLTLLPSRAGAASAGSLDNFAPVRAYDGRFTDLEPWFYDNAVSLYELGLTEGMTADKFGSAEETSAAQAIVFAARISCIYYSGSTAALTEGGAQSGDWYSSSVAYLKDQDVLEQDGPYEGRYDQPATRSFVAQLLAGLLPDSAYADLNGAVVDAGWRSGKYIPDVDESAPYAEAVLKLYRTGILAGYGEHGAFMPDAPIVRRELTAMLTRLVDPDLRIKIEGWQIEEEPASVPGSKPEPEPIPEPAPEPDAGKAPGKSAAGLTMAELIGGTPVFYPTHSLDDGLAIKSNLEYMLQRGELSLTLKFPGRQDQGDRDRLMAAYQDGIRTHFLEQSCAMYVALSSTYSGGDTEVTLTFGTYSAGGALPVQQNQQIRTETMRYATAVHDELWESGTLTAGMTQREIAQVYFNWICAHCRYDYEGLRRNENECHTALGLFRDGEAVCDGYTMAYNLLLEIEGIDCDTACTPEHIWTVATLDGTSWHIDTTWGDQEGFVDQNCFCMTEWEAYHRSGI